MSKYIDLELPILLDLLELHTTHYGKLISEGHYGGDEFTECREIIAEIQEAIQAILDSQNVRSNFQKILH